MLLPFQVAVASAQLAAASIAVTESNGGFTIAAVYRFVPRPDTARFTVARLPNASAQFESSAVVTEQRRLWRIAISPDAQGNVRLSYQTGPLDRIPLPVPTVPTQRGERSVTIDLRLIGGGPPPAESFPRFVGLDRMARATMSNVPSLIQLPRARFRWLRLLEFGVLGLVATTSLAWAATRRNRRQ